MKAFLEMLNTIEITNELINAALVLTFVFGPILKIRKNSAQLIMYGITGRIFIPDVIEVDSIIIATLAVIKKDTPSAIGVNVSIVQYVVTDSQRVLGCA
jgi:hypothetical protein